MSISNRYRDIQERIALAAKKSGREGDAIKIVAVSKFVEWGKIQEALQAGVKILGESRAQELVQKYGKPQEALPPDVAIHFIGNLQRNKVRTVLRYVSSIHSVDRDDLILEIIKECKKNEKRMSVFFELNTAEDTKAGYRNLDDLSRGVELALKHDELEVTGLMTMAANVNDDEQKRLSFRSLAACRELLQRRFPNLNNLELSMGMSNDFEIAVEEGATIVRIGSLLFEGIQT